MSNVGIQNNKTSYLGVPSILPLTIPSFLKGIDNWVLWRAVDRGGRIAKIPYSCDGTPASSTNPQTWSPFDTVLTEFSTGRYSGIGFVFTIDIGLIGIDWDHCRDPIGGVIDPEVLDEVCNLGTYAEISPSGSGIHAISTGQIPGLKHRGNNREMYATDRYFTVTGNILTDCPCNIHSPPNGSLHAIYQKMVGDDDHVKVKTGTPNRLPCVQDEVIIDKAAMEIGERFTNLMVGTISNYESHSHADLALCGYIARYTRQSSQIDRIFRSSGLMREKWDTQHGPHTYGERTVEVALNSQFLIPSHYGNNLEVKP